MTVSENTLRTLAGLSQGRNVAPAWCMGFGPPQHDPALGLSGVSLDNTLLSVVQMFNGFRPSPFDTDYLLMGSGPAAPGSVYDVDYDGTAVQYTVQPGDTTADVMNGLYDALVSISPGDYSDIKRIDVPQPLSGSVYNVIRTVRLGSPAPSITAGFGHLFLDTGASGNATFSVWLYQLQDDGTGVWVKPSGGAIPVVANHNYCERLSTAGFDRIYIEFNGIGLGEAYAAPCTEEVS